MGVLCVGRHGLSDDGLYRPRVACCPRRRHGHDQGASTERAVVHDSSIAPFAEAYRRHRSVRVAHPLIMYPLAAWASIDKPI